MSRFSTYGVGIAAHLLTTFVLCAPFTFVPAQAQTSQQEASVEPHCGYDWISHADHRQALENTAQADPALYERMMADDKGERSIRLSSDGESIHSFYVYNRETNRYDNITGILKHHGPYVRIWVDARDTARLAASEPDLIERLAEGLEVRTGERSRNPELGIVQNDIEVFGTPPTNKFEASVVTEFLLTDIKDGIQGGAVMGYFSPHDQTTWGGSNRMNILYIDSYEGLMGENPAEHLLNTLAHEFQHLIHYGQYGSTETEAERFVNEGCSEVASILCGYKNRTNSSYLRATNVDLFSFPTNSTDGTELERTYQRGMTFFHYLTEQFGEAFLTEFVSDRRKEMARVESAISRIKPNTTWAEASKGFAVANYLRANSDPRYAYILPLSAQTPSSEETFLGTSYPSTITTTLQPYGIAYYNFTKPGSNSNDQALSLRFEGSSYQAVALLFVDGEVTVMELEPGVTHMLTAEGGRPYDRVIISLINLYNWETTAEWITEATKISGVAAGSSAAENAHAVQVLPNPVNDHARIRFTGIKSGPVTIDLYDSRGSHVLRILDEADVTAGMQEIPFNTDGLATGAYTLRILHQGIATTARMVVAQ